MKLVSVRSGIMYGRKVEQQALLWFGKIENNKLLNSKFNMTSEF